ncbi:peptidase family M13 [Ceratocystis lukuohia]|uniref:Peptidase family M13 n=1 Tax=Ceratocystis lukuohia TaxID=2019550 RepID=A0ABR4MMH7_9PEZI
MKFGSILTPGLIAHAVNGQTGSSPPGDDAISASTPDSEYCTTPACLRIAEEFRSNLAPNYADIDPCNNFEELACGGWRLKHDFKPDHSTINTIDLIEDRMVEVNRQAIEGPLPASIDPNSQDAKNFYKMKAIYNACMDVETMKNIGIEPLKKVLAEVDNTDTIKDALLILLKHDTSGLVLIGPQIDDKNPDAVSIGITPPTNLGMPSRDHFKLLDVSYMYSQIMVEVLSKLYPETTSKTLDDLYELDRSIAFATANERERNEIKGQYRGITLEEVDKIIPGLSDIINSLTPEGVATPRIIMHHPRYFYELHDLLIKASPDVLKAYFRWRLIVSYEPFIEHESLQPLKDFNKEFAETEREAYCVDHINDSVDGIMNRFFIEKGFSPEAKTMADKLVADLKGAYIEKFKTVDWMDGQSSDRAIKKLVNMDEKIAYSTLSPNITNPDDLAHMYRYSVVDDKTHFENEVSLRQMRFKMQWEAVGKPTDRNEWQYSPNDASTYYQIGGNELVLPAGLMQFPIFDAEAPAYITYGGYGSMVGSEMTHAFDSIGQQFDEHGAYSETTSWWTPETTDAFNERAQCFVGQYSKFNLPSTREDEVIFNVNGKLTKDVNIADAAGLSIAYQSWKKLNSGKDQKLPELQFTPDQLFFLSFANARCSKDRTPPSVAARRPFAPFWARVSGTLANSEDFLKAFDCPVKEPTCKIW